MSELEQIHVYLTVVFGRLVVRARDDERGQGVSEYVVMIGAALVAAVVIAAIVWGKLRDGAEQTVVPTPAAP